MNERNLDRADLTAKELQVRVEHGGYKGLAWIRRVGSEALKWQIVLAAENGRVIGHWDGPDIQGNGPVIVTVQDIENAQHEINQAIDQLTWDPMSQA